MKISADALVGDGATHTNLVYMKTASASVTAESKLISLRGTAMRNGAMVFVEASKMATGRNLHLQAGAMTEGTIVEAIDNTALTTGHLVHLKSTSASISSEAITVETRGVSSGTGMNMSLEALTTGVGMEMSTNAGNALTNTGAVMRVAAKEVSAGTVVDIGVDQLSTGSAVNVAGGNGMTTGHCSVL